jgi:hypothetical protein
MMATTTNKNKRGSRVRTTRQPLGLVSTNTPPKKQQKPSSNATLEPTFLPPKYISNTANEKQNDDNDEPSIGSMSSTSSRFSYRGIKRMLSVRKTKSSKGESSKKDLLLKENASRNANEEIIDIQTEQSVFVPPKYIYTPPKKELLSKVRTPEPSFIPPKYISATTSSATNEDNQKQHNDDDEPSIGSLSSMSSTASQYSYRGIKRTVSIKIKKKRGLVPKFLKKKSRSTKKKAVMNDLVLQENATARGGDALVHEGLDARGGQPSTFVPPKYIHTPPKTELDKVSTPKFSFVSPKYVATTNALSADQKHVHDKSSMMTPIASISYRGIKYTLSIKDLIDCYQHYLLGKQVVVSQRSRTIYTKTMPRVLRLRLKRCSLDNNATQYMVLKLCQRIILQRLQLHNGIRRKSIRSISKKMKTAADPIRESSSSLLEVNQSVNYSIPQDIQCILLQRKKIHNEIRLKFIQSISRKKMNTVPILSTKSLSLMPSKESCLVAHPSVNDSILQDYMLYPVPNYSDYSFSSSPSLKSTSSVQIHTLEIERDMDESKLRQDIHMNDVELGTSTRYMVMDDAATTSSLIHCFAPLTTHHNVSGRLTVVITLALIGVTAICMHVIRILNH